MSEHKCKAIACRSRATPRLAGAALLVAFCLAAFTHAQLVPTVRNLNGAWDDAAWSNGVPGAAHLAQLNGGAVTLNDARNVGALNISGGQLTGAGALNVAGAATLSGGTLGTTGALTVSGALTLSGTTLTGAGAIHANGGAAITNSFSINNTRSLHLPATSTWSAGYIYAGGGSNITVTPTGNLTTNFDGTLNGTYYGSGTSTTVFNNQGTFTKSSGATNGATNLTAVVQNPGTIKVEAGNLNLGAGGNSTGTVNVANGATFSITGGSFAFENGSQITGAGAVRVSGGTATFSGNNTGSANIVIAGGTAAFEGTTQTTGGGTFSGGTLGGAGSLTFASPITISGTTLTGAGAIHADGGAAIANSFSFNGTRTLNLAGASTWTGGYIYAGGGSTLNVQTGANLTTNFDGTLNGTYYGSGTSTTVFNNQGTFAKTDGAGTTTITAALNNTGIVKAEKGRLSLAGGGTNSGGASLLASLNAEIALADSYTLADGSLLNGPGLVRFTNGVLTINGVATFGVFSFDGGQLAGTHELEGELTWRGGNWNTGVVGPTTTIASGAKLILSSSTTHDFDRRALVNRGSVEWEGNYIRSGHGGSFTNFAGATFKDLTGAGTHHIYDAFGGGFTFANHGTYSKTGAGTTEIEVPFNNHAAVAVQSGVLRLEGGGANASSGTFSTALGAVTEFNGPYSVADGSSLTGAGTYRLANGTFTVNGNVAVGTFQQTGGRLAGTQTFTAGVFDWSGGDWSQTSLGETTTIAAGTTLNLHGSNAHDFDYRAVRNDGAVKWHGHYVRSGHGGTFVNNPGAHFEDRTGTGTHYIYNAFGGTFTFTNHGTYTKFGAGHTEIEVPFHNTSAVIVQQGMLRLQGGGTNSSTGTFNTAAGAATVFESDYTIANGTSLTGAGNYTLASGALTVNGDISVSTFGQTGGKLAGTQRFLAGTIDWNGGDWNAATTGHTTTLAPGATLNLHGGNAHDFISRTIANQGTVNWHGHYVRSGHDGAFTNATGASFNDLTGAGTHYIYNAFGGNFTFTNHGTYAKTGAGTTQLDVPFHNHAAVSVQDGVLRLGGGGANSSSGTFNTASGAITEFNSSYTIADGSSLTGAGAYVLAGGTLNVGGNVTVSTFNQQGGKLADSQTFLTGTINWSGGDWNAATTGPTTAIAGGATLNLHGSNAHDFIARAVTNHGITNWHGHYVRSGHGGSFTNAPGGQFKDLTGTGTHYIYNAFGGDFTFTNRGTYAKSGAGTTQMDATFNNHQLVQIASGRFRIGGGGVNAGTGVFDTASGAVTEFANNFSIADGSSLGGTGLYVLSGGTLTIDGNVSVSTFNHQAGKLAGSQAFTTGIVNWSGGEWNSAAPGPTTVIGAGATLNLQSSNAHDFYARAVTNRGIVNWEGHYVRSGGGGSFTNETTGTFKDRTGAGTHYIYNPFGGTFTFTNKGLYEKNGAGTTEIQAPFSNSGTVSVQGGTLHFTNTFEQTTGVIALANAATLRFGQSTALGAAVLTGHGTVHAPTLTAGSVVSPGAGVGTLAIAGNLTLLSTTQLLIELGAAGHDFLSVSGNASLNGLLAIQLTSGFVAPAATATFTVLTAGATPAALTGAFANIANGQRLFTADGFGSFQVNYGAGSVFAGNSLVLSHFAAVPEPSTWALMLAGAAIVVLQLRRRR